MLETLDESQFQPLMPEHHDILDRFMGDSGYPLCEYTASIQIVWQAYNQSEWMILGGRWLLIRFVFEGQQRFLCPVGKGDFSEVVKRCCTFMKASGKTPVFGFVPACRMEYFPEDVFVSTLDEGEKDYIYLREDLALMEGRRFAKKRNHLKKFGKLYPDWVVAPFQSAHYPQWLSFLEVWCKQNACFENPVLRYEGDAFRRWLLWHNQLKMQAFALRVRGRIVGVSVRERMSEDICAVHFEKAFREVDGAYTMLSWQMARQTDALYINREQDMGDEGLRKSKLSYFPVRLEPAYTVSLRV